MKLCGSISNQTTHNFKSGKDDEILNNLTYIDILKNTHK